MYINICLLNCMYLIYLYACKCIRLYVCLFIYMHINVCFQNWEIMFNSLINWKHSERPIPRWKITVVKTQQLCSWLSKEIMQLVIRCNLQLVWLRASSVQVKGMPQNPCASLRYSSYGLKSKGEPKFLENRMKFSFDLSSVYTCTPSIMLCEEL